MTEIFDKLSAIDDPVKEEDHILASLPECYNMLVTALEANPALAVVTERLNMKMKNRLTAKFKRQVSLL